MSAPPPRVEQAASPADPVSRRAAVAAAALHRRSIRRYLPDPVPEPELRELLTLAGRAPSAWNLQPWRFIVVRDPETKSRLQAAANGQSQVGAAPAVIVVYSDVIDALRRARDAKAAAYFATLGADARDQWGKAQAGIALGYLLLIAETFGLATSPMLGFRPPAVRQLFELPAHIEIAALVAVGYAGEEGRPSSRVAPDEITRWI